MKEKRKVLLVDDNKLFREGVKAILGAHDGYEVAGEAKDGIEALRAIRLIKPDLVLLDISMPKLDGISVIRDIRRENQKVKILVVSMHEKGPFLQEALDQQIKGYCSKDSSRSEFMLAVDSLMKDKLYIDTKVSKTVLAGFLDFLKSESADGILPCRGSNRSSEKGVLK